MADPLIASVWTDQQSGKIVFPRLKRQMVSNAIKDKKRRKGWEGFAYPSGMYWGMCVKEYIQKLKSGEQYIETDPEKIEKMEIGKAMHTMWQDILLQSKDFLAPDPNYPEFTKQHLANKKKLKKGKVRKPPEWYVFCPEWFISGWLDLALIYKGELIICDFKTKNITPSEWDKEKESFPTTKEETQLYIYAVITDKYNYWDRKAKRLRWIYFNNFCVDPALKLDPEFEKGVSIDPVKYEKTILLLNEVRDQILSDCTANCYADCNKHGSSET